MPSAVVGLVLAAGAAAVAVAAGALPLGGPGSDDEADASPVVGTREATASAVGQAGLPAASGPVEPGPLTVDLDAVPPSPGDGGPADGDTISSAAYRSGDRGFHATADSLARGIDFYYSLERRFRDGRVGCPALARAHEWAAELFVRLSLYRATPGGELDSAARRRFRERSRDMEALDRSFRQSGCTRLAGRPTAR